MGTEAVSDAAENALLSIVKRRAKPRVLLLADDFSIAFAEPGALEMLTDMYDASMAAVAHLPEAIESAVRTVVASWSDSEKVEQVVASVHKLIVRVGSLDGPSGSMIAVFLEEHARREDLATVARRYSLTRRETQVLTLLLDGLNAREIAERLCIAEVTVSDYFKSLLRKTQAKNRSDMLARVLGWGNA
ncbi:MAG: helix-turn-helix transcriptional regulator [Vulcanimicrobiaceae bacterium]